MDLYAENVLDHFRHPRNTGDAGDATVSHHEENASCGDDLTLSLVINGDIITAVRWRGTGCALSQAGMSMLSEELVGTSVRDADALSPDHIRSLLGVPVGPRRFKCAMLCLHALRNALRRYHGAGLVDWMPAS